MPELPEVETSCRGIAPHIVNQKVKRMDIRNHKLRWPIDQELPQQLQGQKLESVSRRAKFILLNFSNLTVVVHLGMSGSVRIIDGEQPPNKHDHVDLFFSNKKTLRFNDPRRFGCWLIDGQPITQKLLAKLGPEPLSDQFNVDYLAEQCKKRKAAIKQVIMDNTVVVGVGNIYAAESLFSAGIHPKRAANRVSRTRLENLVRAIKRILTYAIERGGTTLRDFTQSDGKPGYFKQELMVYGREGEPCKICLTPLKGIRQGQRATAYCARCQR